MEVAGTPYRVRRLTRRIGHPVEVWRAEDLLKTFLRNNGLSLVLFALFLMLLVGQSLVGQAVQNDERRDHGQAPVGYVEYLASGAFLEVTMENWESEFLAIWSMVVLSIFLRQRGSPESKPVDAPHSETG